jgi:hypothetical protein
MSGERPPDAAFASFVNLAARELERWLGTEASAAAAADGNAEGPEVLRILRTAKDERTPEDLELMRRVVAHIAAQRERRPDGDVTDSAWRHGLMNWGHDPMTWSPAPLPVAALASTARAAPDPRPSDPSSPPPPPSAPPSDA